MVRKVDFATGHVVLSWPGTLVESSDEVLAVRARFLPRSAQPVFVDGVPFEAGDLFTEYYYPGRWYNVFHIADTDGRRKGWYCNVTRPPEIADDTITYVDLALDLFVHPDGTYTVLDEDEFDAGVGLYTPADIEEARFALRALIELAREGGMPAPEP
jgi:predicted RNA-binding protein associated with RNAse of E/G family